MDILIYMLTAAGAAVASTLVELFKRTLGEEESERETVEHRVRRLTHSLREATELIGSIEAEISSRHALAAKLQEDISTYQQLAAVRKEEVESIAQLLRGEIQREGRRSFWVNVGTNFAFFLLGAGGTVVVTLTL